MSSGSAPVPAPGALPRLSRRVQISGSASAKVDSALIAYGHAVVARLAQNIVSAGGGIVLSVERSLGPKAHRPMLPA